MRLLALFFACYFAFLSCLTCTDEVPVCKNQQQATIAAPHSNSSTGALSDWCSPLCQCQCHCCGGVIMPVALGAQLAYFQPLEWASSLRHAPLVVAAPTPGAGDVWQPPQA